MLSDRSDRADLLLRAWADQARLKPDESEAAYDAVLRRAATGTVAIEALGDVTGGAATAPSWKAALAVANQIVQRARSPLWGGSWTPPCAIAVPACIAPVPPGGAMPLGQQVR